MDKLLDTIRTQLDAFLYGFSSDQLKISLLAGQVTLRDLAFKPEPVNKFFLQCSLPLTLKAGFVSSLSFRVTSIVTGHVEVAIDGLYAVVAPTCQVLGRSETSTHRSQEISQLELLQTRGGRSDATNRAADGCGSAEMEVIRNAFRDYFSKLSLKLTRAHIRLECDDVDVKGSSFAFGLVIESAYLAPTAPAEHLIVPKFSREPRGHQRGRIVRLGGSGGVEEGSEDPEGEGWKVFGEKLELRGVSLHFHHMCPLYVPWSLYEATAQEPNGIFAAIEASEIVSLFHTDWPEGQSLAQRPFTQPPANSNRPGSPSPSLPPPLLPCHLGCVDAEEDPMRNASSRRATFDRRPAVMVLPLWVQLHAQLNTIPAHMAKDRPPPPAYPANPHVREGRAKEADRDLEYNSVNLSFRVQPDTSAPVLPAATQGSRNSFYGVWPAAQSQEGQGGGCPDGFTCPPVLARLPVDLSTNQEVLKAIRFLEQRMSSFQLWHYLHGRSSLYPNEADSPYTALPHHVSFPSHNTHFPPPHTHTPSRPSFSPPVPTRHLHDHQQPHHYHHHHQSGILPPGGPMAFSQPLMPAMEGCHHFYHPQDNPLNLSSSKLRWRRVREFFRLQRYLRRAPITLREGLAMRIHCKRYIAVYKRKFDGPESICSWRRNFPPIDRVAQHILTDIELEYRPEQILLWRLMAHIELRMEMQLNNAALSSPSSKDGTGESWSLRLPGSPKSVGRNPGAGPRLLTQEEIYHLHENYQHIFNSPPAPPPHNVIFMVKWDLLFAAGLRWRHRLPRPPPPYHPPSTTHTDTAHTDDAKNASLAQGAAVLFPSVAGSEATLALEVFSPLHLRITDTPAEYCSSFVMECDGMTIPPPSPQQPDPYHDLRTFSAATGRFVPVLSQCSSGSGSRAGAEVSVGGVPAVRLTCHVARSDGAWLSGHSPVGSVAGPPDGPVSIPVAELDGLVFAYLQLLMTPGSSWNCYPWEGYLHALLGERLLVPVHPDGTHQVALWLMSLGLQELRHAYETPNGGAPPSVPCSSLPDLLWKTLRGGMWSPLRVNCILPTTCLALLPPPAHKHDDEGEQAVELSAFLQQQLRATDLRLEIEGGRALMRPIFLPSLEVAVTLTAHDFDGWLSGLFDLRSFASMCDLPLIWETAKPSATPLVFSFATLLAAATGAVMEDTSNAAHESSHNKHRGTRLRPLPQAADQLHLGSSSSTHQMAAASPLRQLMTQLALMDTLESRRRGCVAVGLPSTHLNPSSPLLDPMSQRSPSCPPSPGHDDIMSEAGGSDEGPESANVSISALGGEGPLIPRVAGSAVPKLYRYNAGGRSKTPGTPRAGRNMEESTRKGPAEASAERCPVTLLVLLTVSWARRVLMDCYLPSPLQKQRRARGAGAGADGGEESGVSRDEGLLGLGGFGQLAASFQQVLNSRGSTDVAARTLVTELYTFCGAVTRQLLAADLGGQAIPTAAPASGAAAADGSPCSPATEAAAGGGCGNGGDPPLRLTVLSLAAWAGITPVIEAFEQHIPGLAVGTLRDACGMTLLMWAARGSFCNSEAINLKLVRYLIRKGAKPGGTDSFGRTSLHWACLSGAAQIAAHLLQTNGTDAVKLNQRDRMGYSPLAFAIMSQSRPLVSLLLNCGADPIVPPLRAALKPKQGSTQTQTPSPDRQPISGGAGAGGGGAALTATDLSFRPLKAAVRVGAFDVAACLLQEAPFIDVPQALGVASLTTAHQSAPNGPLLASVPRRATAGAASSPTARGSERSVDVAHVTTQAVLDAIRALPAILEDPSPPRSPYSNVTNLRPDAPQWTASYTSTAVSAPGAYNTNSSNPVALLNSPQLYEHFINGPDRPVGGGGGGGGEHGMPGDVRNRSISPPMQVSVDPIFGEMPTPTPTASYRLGWEMKGGFKGTADEGVGGLRHPDIGLLRPPLFRTVAASLLSPFCHVIKTPRPDCPLNVDLSAAMLMLQRSFGFERAKASSGSIKGAANVPSSAAVDLYQALDEQRFAGLMECLAVLNDRHLMCHETMHTYLREQREQQNYKDIVLEALRQLRQQGRLSLLDGCSPLREHHHHSHFPRDTNAAATTATTHRHPHGTNSSSRERNKTSSSSSNLELPPLRDTVVTGSFGLTPKSYQQRDAEGHRGPPQTHRHAALGAGGGASARFIVVGPPRVGKSTVAKWLVDNLHGIDGKGTATTSREGGYPDTHTEAHLEGGVKVHHVRLSEEAIHHPRFHTSLFHRKPTCHGGNRHTNHPSTNTKAVNVTVIDCPAFCDFIPVMGPILFQTADASTAPYVQPSHHKEDGHSGDAPAWPFDHSFRLRREACGRVVVIVVLDGDTDGGDDYVRMVCDRVAPGRHGAQVVVVRNTRRESATPRVTTMPSPVDPSQTPAPPAAPSTHSPPSPFLNKVGGNSLEVWQGNFAELGEVVSSHNGTPGKTRRTKDKEAVLIKQVVTVLRGSSSEEQPYTTHHMVPTAPPCYNPATLIGPVRVLTSSQSYLAPTHSGVVSTRPLLRCLGGSDHSSSSSPTGFRGPLTDLINAGVVVPLSSVFVAPRGSVGGRDVSRPGEQWVVPQFASLLPPSHPLLPRLQVAAASTSTNTSTGSSPPPAAQEGMHVKLQYPLSCSAMRLSSVVKRLLAAMQTVPGFSLVQFARVGEEVSMGLDDRQSGFFVSFYTHHTYSPGVSAMSRQGQGQGQAEAGRTVWRVGEQASCAASSAGGDGMDGDVGMAIALSAEKFIEEKLMERKGSRGSSPSHGAAAANQRQPPPPPPQTTPQPPAAPAPAAAPTPDTQARHVTAPNASFTLDVHSPSNATLMEILERPIAAMVSKGSTHTSSNTPVCTPITSAVAHKDGDHGNGSRRVGPVLSGAASTTSSAPDDDLTAVWVASRSGAGESRELEMHAVGPAAGLAIRALVGTDTLRPTAASYRVATSSGGAEWLSQSQLIESLQRKQLAAPASAIEALLLAYSWITMTIPQVKKPDESPPTRPQALQHSSTQSPQSPSRRRSGRRLGERGCHGDQPATHRWPISPDALPLLISTPTVPSCLPNEVPPYLPSEAIKDPQRTEHGIVGSPTAAGRGEEAKSSVVAANSPIPMGVHPPSVDGQLNGLPPSTRDKPSSGEVYSKVVSPPTLPINKKAATAPCPIPKAHHPPSPRPFSQRLLGMLCGLFQCGRNSITHSDLHHGTTLKKVRRGAGVDGSEEEGDEKVSTAKSGGTTATTSSEGTSTTGGSGHNSRGSRSRSDDRRPAPLVVVHTHKGSGPTGERALSGRKDLKPGDGDMEVIDVETDLGMDTENETEESPFPAPSQGVSYHQPTTDSMSSDIGVGPNRDQGQQGGQAGAGLPVVRDHPAQSEYGPLLPCGALSLPEELQCYAYVEQSRLRALSAKKTPTSTSSSKAGVRERERCTGSQSAEDYLSSLVRLGMVAKTPPAAPSPSPPMCQSMVAFNLLRSIRVSQLESHSTWAHLPVLLPVDPVGLARRVREAVQDGAVTRVPVRWEWPCRCVCEALEGPHLCHTQVKVEIVVGHHRRAPAHTSDVPAGGATDGCVGREAPSVESGSGHTHHTHTHTHPAHHPVPPAETEEPLARAWGLNLLLCGEARRLGPWPIEGSPRLVATPALLNAIAEDVCIRRTVGGWLCDDGHLRGVAPHVVAGGIMGGGILTV
ncbi:unnamed protein product [Vitrella brassicaformis CCMP3155]|uniref:Uncharacterized protein n=7 Tax=Vitrella brassicaformis TaxID=1169539 RepID=A0A0G4G5B5_VITBC|nr:unnamed protein product [Vitrella brassicaformis CCMP3155]|eukprot:CEM23551.1 unnamed protein product [Vitrella brassicaformis CCMP3155]